MASQHDVSQPSSYGLSSQDTMHDYKSHRNNIPSASDWPLTTSHTPEHLTYLECSRDYQPGIDKIAQAYGYFQRVGGRESCVIPANYVISSHVVPAGHDGKVCHDHDYIPRGMIKSDQVQVSTSYRPVI